MLQEDTDTFQTQRQQTTPYILFVQKNRDIIGSQNPNLSNTDIAIKLSVMWSNMSNEQRAPYIDESSANKFSFSFTDETEKHNKPQTYASQITESIINSASQISSLDYPLDPENYLVWLGSRVVSQFYNAHGYLPDDLTNLLENRPY
ncbi:hypothetical protein M9Y10_029340 [Tritrichomonas musculus]|uniref:HMG box domain-containing protein n=1 Tax=Tritrichomonas musculus TaxID=1915356 RepID=A0ABR2KLT6_9EUKA